MIKKLVKAQYILETNLWAIIVVLVAVLLGSGVGVLKLAVGIHFARCFLWQDKITAVGTRDRPFRVEIL